MPGKVSDCLLRPSIKRGSYEEGAAVGPFVVMNCEDPGEKQGVRDGSYVVTLCCTVMSVGTDCCLILKLKVAAAWHEGRKERCVPIPPCYALPSIPKLSHLHHTICGTGDLIGFPGCWISAYLKLESPVFDLVYLHPVDANFLDPLHLTQIP